MVSEHAAKKLRKSVIPKLCDVVNKKKFTHMKLCLYKMDRRFLAPRCPGRHLRSDPHAPICHMHTSPIPGHLHHRLHSKKHTHCSSPTVGATDVTEVGNTVVGVEMVAEVGATVVIAEVGDTVVVPEVGDTVVIAEIEAILGPLLDPLWTTTSLFGWWLLTGRSFTFPF